MNNTVVLAAARIWRLGSGFLLAPYVLTQLGPEQYGLFAVLGTVTQYIGLLDFGLGTAFIKHLAEYSVKHDHKHVRQVITFGVLFYVALGLLVAPVAFLIFSPIIDLLKLDPELKSTGVEILGWLFVYFFVVQATSMFSQLQNSMQRMTTVAVIASIGQVIYIAAVILFLYWGWNIRGIVAASFVQLAFGATASFIMATRAVGFVFCNPLHIELDVVKKLLKFGGWMQVMSFSLLVNSQTDRFLIGSFVSVVAVTPYELANRLAFLTKAFPGFGFEALLPALTSIASLGEPGRLNRACIQASRVVALATLAIGGFTIAAAPQLVEVWVGGIYPEAAPIMVILVVGNMVHNLTGVGSTVMRATGQPRYEAYYSILGVILNIAATLALAPTFHVFGIIVGTLIGTVVSSGYFLWVFHRARGISLWTGFGEWLWRLVAGAGAASASLAYLLSLLPPELFAKRLSGLVILASVGLAYLVWLAVLLRIVRFIRPTDVSQIVKTLPGWCAGVLKWRPVQRAIIWISA